MSFGKRMQEPKASAKVSGGQRVLPAGSSARPHGAAGTGDVPPHASALLPTLLASLLAVMCLAVAWFGYQQYLANPDNVQSEPDDGKIFIGPRPPNLALLKSKGASGWAFRDCTFGDPDEAMRRYKAAPFSRDPFGGSASDIFKNHAAFLGCVAQSSERPLCEGSVRKAFVADTEKFFKDFATVAPNMVSFQAGSQNDNTIANVMRELSNAHPELGEQMQAPRDTMVEARFQVLETVRDAATQGLLSSADFGFFAPAEIKTILNETPASGQACK